MYKSRNDVKILYMIYYSVCKNIILTNRNFNLIIYRFYKKKEVIVQLIYVLKQNIACFLVFLCESTKENLKRKKDICTYFLQGTMKQKITKWMEQINIGNTSKQKLTSVHE